MIYNETVLRRRSLKRVMYRNFREYHLEMNPKNFFDRKTFSRRVNNFQLETCHGEKLRIFSSNKPRAMMCERKIGIPAVIAHDT